MNPRNIDRSPAARWPHLLAAGAVVACGVASAAVVTMTQSQFFNMTASSTSFAISNLNGTVTSTPAPSRSASAALTFNQFNPSLGTLTGVQLTLTSVYSSSVLLQARAFSGELSTFFADGVLGFAIANLEPGVLSGLPDETATASCATSTQCTAPTVPLAANLNRTAAGTPSWFTGTGTLSLEAQLFASLTGRVSPDNGTGYADNATFTGVLGSSNWLGSVQLQYIYSEADSPTAETPEPGVLALVGLGLGGLLVARHRR